MTEEEIVKGAEERKLTWLSNYTIGCHKLKEEAKEKNILPNFASFDEMFWKMRFIEGAKFALNNHWHDLRENPEDLPKLEDKRFPWSITVANQDGKACEYNYRLSRWQDCLGGEIDEPIAWTELPKYGGGVE